MTTQKKIKIGDLVWAKYGEHEPWPGKVCIPPPEIKKPRSTSKAKRNKTKHGIWFFGPSDDEEYAWVEEDYIQHYQEHKKRNSKASKADAFKKACSEIEDYIRDNSEDIKVFPGPDSTLDETKQENAKTNKEQTTSASTTPKSKKRKRPADSTTRESPQKNLPGSSQKKICARKGESITRKRKTVSTTPAADSTSFDFPRPSAADMPLDHSSSFKSATLNIVHHYHYKIMFVCKSPLLVFNIANEKASINQINHYGKKIAPSKLKFGFLGLGIMGRGIVKNLLISGHKVIAWNRSPEKCKDFIEAGAEQGATPSDVVSSADITFSSVADPQTVKEMVFSICGVMKGMESGKSYVEMTGIDAETSKDIEEAISIKGGRYLVAQLHGSKQESEDGQLLILCSGDRSLYDDCLTAFSAMGKTSFFLNGNVESSTKMNMVLQLITGIMISGLAEGMALADRAGLEMKDVLDVLALTSVSSPFIKEKGQFMAESQFPTQMPLQHMQKDLNFSLEMGNSFNQPLPMAAAANEVFKHAKRLGYSDQDCAALYSPARF